MKIEKFQTTVTLNMKNMLQSNLNKRLKEIVNYAKEFENEKVIIDKVVDLGRVKGGVQRYLITLNHERDLDNLGERFIP